MAIRPCRRARRAREIGACGGRGEGYGAASLVGMHFPQFLRIERDGPRRPRHTVVHMHDPGFWMELAPDAAAPDRVGHGVLQRICVPNSWAGDYEKYFRLVGAAQRFFAASFGAPKSKAAPRRS